MDEHSWLSRAEHLWPAFGKRRRDESREGEDLARLWGVAVCAGCGRTILLGESTRHGVIDGRRVELCEACALREASRDRQRAA